MPKLPSGKFHESSHGSVSSAAVSTNSPKRSRNETKRLAETTKSRFDSVFPENFSATDYAEALLAKCAALPQEKRTSEVDSTIRKLLDLERLSYAFSLAERAEFFRLAKRAYVSRLLESAVSKLKNAEYRQKSLGPWSKWIYAHAFTDIGDFWFWNGWRDRFFAEEHAPYEDLPISI